MCRNKRNTPVVTLFQITAPLTSFPYIGTLPLNAILVGGLLSDPRLREKINVGFQGDCLTRLAAQALMRYLNASANPGSVLTKKAPSPSFRIHCV